MTKEFLHGADVIAVFKQMGSKAVAESMTTAVLGNARLPNGLLDRALDIVLVKVVTADDACARLGRTMIRRKDVLPGPFFVGIRIFSFQRVGQIDCSIAFFQVLRMDVLGIR